MFYYFWMLLGVVSFVPSSQQLSPLCQSMSMKFYLESGALVPEFCTPLQNRFNSVDYRIDFTEAEISSVCASDVCQALMKMVVLPCITFVRYICD